MLVSLFICPICQSPLQPAADTWRCDGSLNAKQQAKKTVHSFDVARQGYVNLLPVQQKKSKAPGDSQQSIEARQRFLNAGYYQPLQALIHQQIEKLLITRQSAQSEVMSEQNEEQLNWLDIGCGEGYYTQDIAQIADGIIDNLIAADISKSAVLELAKASKAAKRLWLQVEDNNKNPAHCATIYPLVTSAANLPIRAQSIIGISSIFSPILPEAFATVLQSAGYLIIAKPDIGHLASVRDALFDDVREHNSAKFLTELAPFFDLLQTHHVSTELTLPTEALADLLTMTPYAYRAHSEKRQALLAMAKTQAFKTEAKFVVYMLQKTDPNRKPTRI